MSCFNHYIILCDQSPTLHLKIAKWSAGMTFISLGNSSLDVGIVSRVVSFVGLKVSLLSNQKVNACLLLSFS